MDELAHELLYMRQDDITALPQPPPPAAASDVVQSFQTRGGGASIVPRSSSHHNCPGACWSSTVDSTDNVHRQALDAELSARESRTRPPYYEHLGGYGMEELKDYNEYSKRNSTVVARVARRLPCIKDHSSSPRRRIPSADYRLDGDSLRQTPTGPSPSSGYVCPLAKQDFTSRSTHLTRADYHRMQSDCSVNERDETTTMYVTSL